MKRGVLGLLLLLGGANSHAETTGTLAGQITDPTGAALPGVTLNARHLETGLQRVGASDGTGSFVLPRPA